MSERVRLSVSNHIAEVTLCRANKLNALDQAGFDELSAVVEKVRDNPDVRVVLLLAEGDHFCSGADKSFLQGAVSDKAVFKRRALELTEGENANEFQKPVMGWVDLDVPVIACLQGVAFGAGMQLAMAADIRVADHSAQLSLFEIHWGLIPDMGVTQTLPRLVRADVALDLFVTGRVVEAVEAKELGLITYLSAEAKQLAKQKAEEIAAKSPNAVMNGKRLLRESRDMQVADALRLEAQLQSELVGSKNQVEAAMANLEKRAAVFS